MRGFQVHLDEAQIGTTIDGFPNGTSDYWSGSKANRFIDAANMGDVQVSQGTADLASRSIEALGGTFDFATADPERERAYTASISLGENDAQRYYLRFDTGALLDTETYAWVSASRQESRDWCSRPCRRARPPRRQGGVDGGAHRAVGLLLPRRHRRPSYQRLFTAAEYAQDPRWDRLSDTWTDTPWVNQVYRAGWNIPRRNTFGYLKADIAASDTLTLSAGAYFHRQRGRGDWMPPYIVDVTDDGGGPESELQAGAAVRGGDPLGQLHFAGPDGVRLAPAPGCVSSLLFPYGGAGPEHDPAGLPPGPRGAPAVVPPQPLRQGPLGPDARRGVVPGRRQRRQPAAGRLLVRGFAAPPRPRLAQDHRRPRRLPLRREPLLAAVRLALPAAHRQVVRGGHLLRRRLRVQRRRQALHRETWAAATCWATRPRWKSIRTRTCCRRQGSPGPRRWRGWSCSPATRRTSSR